MKPERNEKGFKSTLFPALTCTTTDDDKIVWFEWVGRIVW